MKLFEGWNKESICPVCNTNKEGKCVLIPMLGTQKGTICEAKPVHLDCIDLSWLEAAGSRDVVIFQKVELAEKVKVKK